ncbi:hypothetical protein Trco_000466 [Trichoderma cornu-damae]|uniref:Uncharacterized protein n=1 Tax=Trichoderma cornu-damae TaxID=654480 RepID=A0A9P8TWD0_9HYPO|nr:hypothetical protein Trco_000466 [Trichoderma cornu-damae]
MCFGPRLFGQTNNANALREYRTKRLQIKPCPGQTSTENTDRIPLVLTDNAVEGFVACEACYEDYIVGTGFQFNFRTCVEGISKWSCDLSIPYILGVAVKMSKHNNWNGFTTAASRRLRLSACKGKQIRSDSVEWYLPKDYDIDNFQVCETCYLDKLALTPFGGEFQRLSDDFYPALWCCGLADGNVSTALALGAALGRRDFEAVEEFNICEACYAGLIQTRGLDRFFQPSDGDSSTAYIKGYGKSRWWGYPEAPFCQECFLDFVAHTPLAESLPMNGEHIEQTTLCQIWSPRMRGLWLEVCEAGEPGSEDSDAALEEFKACCVQRLEAYLATISEIEAIRAMQNIKRQTAFSQGLLSIQEQ